MERLRRSITSMRTLPIVVCTALVSSTLAATTAHSVPLLRASGAHGGAGISPTAEYSAAVAQICAGSLLFDGPHEIGTRADALAIARDIKASTARRLALVTALSVPVDLELTSSRWISSQRALAALYAQLWVRIYDTIAAARTPNELATRAVRLEKLVHAPDTLKLAARRLELKLRVPDCTGGG
jgi:hypothetical protein